MCAKKPQILLADDHPSMLDKIVTLLEKSCEIVGTARDGQAAVDQAIQLDPDIVLLDISMPVMTGIQAAEHLIRKNIRAKIIFLTVHNDSDFVRAALATGAAGYVLKSHMATDLVSAIEKALAGFRFVSPQAVSQDHNGR